MVAAELSSDSTRTSIQRFRAVASDEGRVQVMELLELSGRAVGLSASGSRVAVALSERGQTVTGIWDFSSSAPPVSSPLWSSPVDCFDPALDSSGRRVVLTCRGGGRRPDFILLHDVDSAESLSLAGEWPWAKPAFGPGGDLFFAEHGASEFRVLRRVEESGAYVVHTLLDPVRSLWPQWDGSILAELDLPGSRREALRLLPGGATRPEALGAPDSSAPQPLDPLSISLDGGLAHARCGRAACQVTLLPAGGDSLPPFALPAEASALALVSAPGTKPSEDLATGPASSFRDHRSTQLLVLGVALGDSLETAWSALDRGGRHPYWLGSRLGRGRPAGIGVGAARDGHCLVYEADVSGFIAAIELRGCADRYLSPALSDLFEVSGNTERRRRIARQFLGPGVEASVRSEPNAGADARGMTREVRFHYDASERGYVFEASTEWMRGNPTRWLGGEVLVRLQPPNTHPIARP